MKLEKQSIFLVNIKGDKMFNIERYNIVKEIKGIFNKGYLTGSYELGCLNYNDIDILIMRDKLPNIDFFLYTY